VKSHSLRLFSCCLLLAAAASPARGQADDVVPVDHFPGLRFDAPVPAVVATGEAVRLSGDVAEPWDELVFSFRPLTDDPLADNGAADTDIYVSHLPGRIERDHVFTSDQAGTYQLLLFAGPAGGSLDFVGLFEPFVVEAAPGPIWLPEAFFDGVRLDEPLRTEAPAGIAMLFAGAVLDGRIRSLRLDLSRDGADLGRLPVPLENGRFAAPLRLPEVDPGPLRVDLVVGLTDGTFWGRGGFDFTITDGAVPQAAPAVLSVALLPGGDADVVLQNRGGADLEVLDAEADPPFDVVDLPAAIPPGGRGTIAVRYRGAGGDEGELRLHTNDPQRPWRRVALLGVADGETGPTLSWARADAGGTLTVAAPVGSERFALALFSPQHVVDPAVAYPFVAAGPAPAARAVARWETSPDLTDRQRGEALRAAKAARLAQIVQQRGRPAARRAQVSYAVGDERTFVFDDFPPVARQVLPVRVVAVSQRAVAFVHAGSSADGRDLSVADIEAHLSTFDGDYERIVHAFGTPSDVDGDGRIAFLYTPLVDEVNLGGFQDPASVLDEASGGTGDLADLLFLSPTQPPDSYRSLLVHEFQHLINFHQHVLVRGGNSEATWLDEGLSHLAEDLVDGFVTGGNVDNVRQYLRAPGAVGLTAQNYVTAAERGAAYLFVRSLVDRFGEGILLRLVQTGLSDRDTVEEAVGVPFRELLAGFGVRLFASGTGLAGHGRFDFEFAGLGGPDSRGFPLPAILRTDGTAVIGSLRPRGVAFLDVHAPSVTLTAPADAELSGVVIPLPADFVAAVDIPADHFAGVRFDPPLPGVVAAGEPVDIRGQTTGGDVGRISLQYSIGPEVVAVYDATTDADGRFSRTVVLPAGLAGELDLHVFVGDEGSFAGFFGPVRALAGDGATHLPAGYFDGLELDGPFPVHIPDGQTAALAGRLLEEEITDVQVHFSRDGRTELVVDLPVSGNRFAQDPLFAPGQLSGLYEMDVYAGGREGLPWRGSYEIRIGGAPITAVTVEELAARPEQYGLAAPYPNPFNSGTVVPLRTPLDGDTEVAVFSLTGQRVATLHAGWLPGGLHRLRWDGRDSAGRTLASGVYLVRARAGRGDERVWEATSKVLLLR
jgi:hypothetical protein